MEDSPSNTQRSELRIQRFALGIALLCVIGYWILLRNWVAPLSVVLGALLAWLNFRWLSTAIEGVLRPANSRRIKYLIAKFLLRLVLILIVLCVIIRVSLSATGGVLLGLSVYILAIMAEAISSLFQAAKR
ncbi:MAG TPA: ATP synthase subunit I [Acidobacteriota bacterium]|jgi:uncharacterized Tic20 family protein